MRILHDTVKALLKSIYLILIVIWRRIRYTKDKWQAAFNCKLWYVVLMLYVICQTEF